MCPIFCEKGTSQACHSDRVTGTMLLSRACWVQKARPQVWSVPTAHVVVWLKSPILAVPAPPAVGFGQRLTRFDIRRGHLRLFARELCFPLLHDHLQYPDRHMPAGWPSEFLAFGRQATASAASGRPLCLGRDLGRRSTALPGPVISRLLRISAPWDAAVLAASASTAWRSVTCVDASAFPVARTEALICYV